MYTVLIPSYNEKNTIRKVLEIATAAEGVGQVLLVDDGSTDNTLEVIKNVSPLVEVVSHAVNKGKGAAVATGIKHAKYECVVLIDADLVNITPEKITSLAEPILQNRADFVKASFTLARGRVTEIAVKPMMQILFPDNYFEQPIGGQFATKLSFLKQIKIIEDWGLDIGILLDAISKKLRIEEVFIGEIEHKARSEDSKAIMSMQVLQTMIQKAGLLSNKYKLVLFNCDESLIKNYSLESLMKFIGREEEFSELEKKHIEKEILPIEYYVKLAELFNGVSVEKVNQYVETLELRTYAAEIVMHLKRRKYQVGIVTMHFSPIVKAIAKRLDISLVQCLDLKTKSKKFTGEMTRQTVLSWFNGTISKGYLKAIQQVVTASNCELEGTMAVASQLDALPLLMNVGFSVAYRSKDKLLRKQADKTISILPELLMLVE